MGGGACCRMRDICVRSLSTRPGFLRLQNLRYLCPDIVFTTRKPIELLPWTWLLLLEPSLLLQRERKWVLVPSTKRSDRIVLLQDLLVEGRFLNIEVSSFIAGMKDGNGDEVGRRPRRLGSTKARVQIRDEFVENVASFTTNGLFQADVMDRAFVSEHVDRDRAILKTKRNS